MNGWTTWLRCVRSRQALVPLIAVGTVLIAVLLLAQWYRKENEPVLVCFTDVSPSRCSVHPSQQIRAVEWHPECVDLAGEQHCNRTYLFYRIKQIKASVYRSCIETYGGIPNQLNVASFECRTLDTRYLLLLVGPGGLTRDGEVKWVKTKP